MGQRAPTEAAATEGVHAAQDALLPYELPPMAPLVKSLPITRHLLSTLPVPTAQEIEVATHELLNLRPVTASEEPGTKRVRLISSDAATRTTPASVVQSALAEFKDNFAIISATPAASGDERDGVEMPHQVRWLPQGPRAGAMASVAVLEHAIARCKQVGAIPDVANRPELAEAIHEAALSLKLQQLSPLYALREAVAFEDDPHPLGTDIPLVTRPCAIVRGVLSYPTEPGVVHMPLRCTNGVINAGTDLKNAMKETAAQTAAVRNELRRNGMPSNVYVAPPSDALSFTPAPTGTPFHSSSDGQVSTDVHESIQSEDLSVSSILRLVNQCIVYQAAIRAEERSNQSNGAEGSEIAGFLELDRMDHANGVNAVERREGLWTEFHRHLSISQDRLWVFMRLLSGGIGGDVNEVVTMADQASQQATKALQAQRTEVAKRVSDTQSKIVESVVAGMLKDSKLAFHAEAQNLVVIDTDARKDLQSLASGTSGRPFFEANVACRNLSETKTSMPLKTLLSQLASVGTQMQRSLDTTMTAPGLASASLSELSHPSNSFFVSMKTDASAAVRIAHERLNSELAIRGGTRRIALWELVEGGCSVLVTRFADFTGHILVQNRSSTGVSAMYISHNAIVTNAHQARVSIARLTNAALAYTARVTAPRFDALDGAGVDGCMALGAARKVAMDKGSRVTEADVSSGFGSDHSRSRNGYGSLHHQKSASGWSVMP